MLRLHRNVDFKSRGFTFLFNENNLLLDLVVDIGISRLSCELYYDGFEMPNE